MLALALVVAVGGGLPPVGAQQSNRAGLIVDFGDRYITRCVEFTESEITGYDLLRRAGLTIVVDASNPMGVIICDINNTSGCAASDCFCQCEGSPCVYWSYHYLKNGSWQYSQLGASSRKVHDGDVEGWGWGEGQLNSSGAQPPVIPFDQICESPATDTPVPTDTPMPPTDTPVPTHTPSPTDTPEPEQEATSVPAPEAWFRLDENPIDNGSCTMLRWDTSSAQEVYLDGDEVSMIGSRQVCPGTPTDYELRVVGVEEEKTFRLTLGVTGSAAATSTEPPTASPLPSPTTAELGESTPAAGSPTPVATPTAAPSSTPPATQAASSATIASPSSTPVQIAQVKPTATAAQVAQAEDMAQQPIPPDSEEARSPLLPIGYAVFSLIVGGLLGWLIYILRLRGERG